MTAADKLLAELCDAWDEQPLRAAEFNGRLVAKIKRHVWAVRNGMEPPKENDR